MTLPRNANIGGWSTGRLQLSLFIQDFMSDGQPTWGYAIYSAYREAMAKEPTRKSGKKRKAIGFAAFANYMYMFRRLGLIEYVTDTAGVIQASDPKRGNVDEPWVDDPATGTKGGAKRQLIRMVPGKESDPAWSNPRRALYG